MQCIGVMMMTMKQYRRLLLVAVLPLMLMGIFFADSELIFEAGYVVKCQNAKSKYSCFAYSARREERSREYFESILNFNGALLNEPIVEEVFVFSINEKNVERKLIAIPPVGLRSISPYGSCSINSYRTGSRYYASCSGLESFDFEFVNAGTVAKFKALDDEILRLEQDWGRRSMQASIVSLLFPLAVFLMSSLVVFIFVRIYKFVKGSD